MKYLVTLAVVAALCVPAAALAADPTPSAKDVAMQQCKTQRASMKATDFKALYGTNKTKSNAFGKCIVKAAQLAKTELQNASQQCRTEQADTSFAGSHDGKTFDQYYGTAKGKGAKGADANSFGKCVSSKVKDASDAQTEAVVNAAKTCKTLAKDKANWHFKSFGACVSKNTKQS